MTKKGINFHIQTSYHNNAHNLSKDFVNSFDDSGEKSKLKTLASKEEERMFAFNKKLLTTSIKSVRLCETMGIALRGKDLKKSEKQRPGNLRSIFDALSEKDIKIRKLNQSVQTSSKRVITMQSNQTQNEIINIFGTKILDQIIKEISQSQMFTLISDETSQGCVQFLTVGVRY